MGRRTFLLLLGEKAGMREDVIPLINIQRKLEPTHVGCYKFIHFVK